MSNGKIRYVVMYLPGPAWKSAVEPTAQSGVKEHRVFLAGLHERGKVALAGPFLTPDAGGMILLTEGVSDKEAEGIGAMDPLFKSGVIRYEVRPWKINFQR